MADKITIGDAYDRYKHYKKQSDYISQGCEDCIRNRPSEFGNVPFYIFAHKRQIGLDERKSMFSQDLMESLQNPLRLRQWWKIEDVPSHRYIWSPRLTKPTPQTNSMLFKAYPPGDNIKIIWIIPERALWGQYKKDNITESSDVSRSIELFENNRIVLERKEEDDLSEEEISRIYAEISRNAHQRKNKLHGSTKTS